MLAIARDCIRKAIASVDPRAAVSSVFQRSPAGDIRVAGETILPGQRVIVIGGGKASIPMVQGIQDAIEGIEGVEMIGHVVTKDGHSAGLCVPDWCGVTEAAHPIPDWRGVEGTRRVMELAAAATADDLVIAVISGGGSALLTAPIGLCVPGAAAESESHEAAARSAPASSTGSPDLSGLAAVQATTSALLGCGATIHDVNRVRACLDTVKGGGLARAAWPARLVTLVLSDVIGDDLSTIASGVTILGGRGQGADKRRRFPGHGANEALRVLETYGLAAPGVPQRVMDHLRRAAAAEDAAAASPAEDAIASSGAGPGPDYGAVCVVASNARAVAAFEAACAGMEVLTLTAAAEGEAADVGRLLVRIGRHRSAVAGGRGLVVLMGGETTVRLPAAGAGRGGRNQHMALAAALELQAWEESEAGVGAVFVAVGTDGTDGPTDAAGGIVTSQTAAAARAAGVNPDACLQACDSYKALEAAGVVLMDPSEPVPVTGGLLKSGPTGTNVMDIYAVFVPAADAPPSVAFCKPDSSA